MEDRHHAQFGTPAEPVMKVPGGNALRAGRDLDTSWTG